MRLSTPIVMAMRTNGAALRALRQHGGLTVQEVVDALEKVDLSIHPNYLRNVETGAKDASPQLLRGLADVLRVPLTAITASNEDGPTEGLATEAQVGSYLRLSARQMRRIRVEGIGPAVVRLGRQVRYRWSDVEAYIEAHREAKEQAK